LALRQGGTPSGYAQHHHDTKSETENMSASIKQAGSLANTKAGTLSPSSRLEGLQVVRALEFDCHNHTPRKLEALDHAMCYGAAMIP
jgi:hypothetical protein